MKHRLSRRISAVAPSATLAVAAKAREMAEQGIDVVSFGAGEPNFDTPAHVVDAAVAALRGGDTRYPPVNGRKPLRQAISGYLKRHCDAHFPADHICVTVGAKDALFYAFAATIDPGDEVLIPAPYWVSYPDQVRLVDGVPVIVKPDRGLKVSAAALAKAVTPRTKALVINSPNNPSGAVFSRVELEAIARVAEEHNLLIISDEIYHRLVFGGVEFTSFAALPGMLERTLVINGASKTFAMTGWRLGYAAGPKWLIDAIAKLQGQTTSGAASFVQAGATEAFGGDQECVEHMRVIYERRGMRMAEALNAISGVQCEMPEGAFYCFPNVSKAFARLEVADADAFATLVLERAHVALVSGVAFGAPEHCRLSFAASDDEIEKGLERLARLLG
ncbi:MAG: aminotransferase [Planctomycetota bacterium]